MQRTLQVQITQTENELTFNHLIDLGYNPKVIRVAMLDLLGLTPTGIANILGTSRPAITQIIHGSRRTPQLQEKIAGIYDVPVDVLFPDRLQCVCIRRATNG